MINDPMCGLFSNGHLRYCGLFAEQVSKLGTLVCRSGCIYCNGTG